MSHLKDPKAAYARGRADAAAGKSRDDGYRLTSKSRTTEAQGAYDEGFYDKRREMKKS